MNERWTANATCAVVSFSAAVMFGIANLPWYMLLNLSASALNVLIHYTKHDDLCLPPIDNAV